MCVRLSFAEDGYVGGYVQKLRVCVRVSASVYMQVCVVCVCIWHVQFECIMHKDTSMCECLYACLSLFLAFEFCNQVMSHFVSSVFECVPHLQGYAALYVSSCF